MQVSRLYEFMPFTNSSYDSDHYLGIMEIGFVSSTAQYLMR